MWWSIIIKTTYDISLDFQDSLLPLGFLSLSHTRLSHPLTFLSSFTSRLEVNEVNGNETGVGEGMENEGVDNRHVTSRSPLPATRSIRIIVHTRSPSRNHPHGRQFPLYIRSTSVSVTVRR